MNERRGIGIGCEKDRKEYQNNRLEKVGRNSRKEEGSNLKEDCNPTGVGKKKKLAAWRIFKSRNQGRGIKKNL